VQVDQAIFTSAQTDRAEGYQIVSRSEGLSQAEARELAVWCPAHDSLVDPAIASYNFHALASGRLCVSKTVAAGSEYSARGGALVYTNCLIASAEGLVRFANNPFALLQAALASGGLEVLEAPPPRLAPLRLLGRASPLDRTLLAQLASNPGPAIMARLVEAVLRHRAVLIVGRSRAEQLVQGLVNCLPVELRRELTFSTGLRQAACRPLRLVWLGSDRVEAKRVARQIGAAVFDLDQEADEPSPSEGWPGLVAAALAEGRPNLLAESLDPSPRTLSFESVEAPGNQRRARLAPLPTRAEAASVGAPCAPAVQRADGAHARHAGAAASVAVRPAAMEGIDDPQTVELLECLDDAVYEALAGDASALARLEVLWPVVLEKVGPELVESTREHYLKSALAQWSDLARSGARDAQRAGEALDVLCLLFGEE
jgi:hypothetical protein